MSFSAGQFNMQVVHPGGARVVDNAYKGDGATTFAKGDLVRINTSGQIKDATAGAATAGDVHGMVLDTWATAPTTSQYVPIMKFASDTVLATQLWAAAGGDAEPQDVSVGTGYRLKNNSAGIWSIDVANADGSAIVVQKGDDDAWFIDGNAVDEDFGIVYVQFAQAILDGYQA